MLKSKMSNNDKTMAGKGDKIPRTPLMLRSRQDEPTYKNNQTTGDQNAIKQNTDTEYVSDVKYGQF